MRSTPLRAQTGRCNRHFAGQIINLQASGSVDAGIVTQRPLHYGHDCCQRHEWIGWLKIRRRASVKAKPESARQRLDRKLTPALTPLQ
jgi:hypothetical protein